MHERVCWGVSVLVDVLVVVLVWAGVFDCGVAAVGAVTARCRRSTRYELHEAEAASASELRVGRCRSAVQRQAVRSECGWMGVRYTWYVQDKGGMRRT